jgi:hypothetical protein
MHRRAVACTFALVVAFAVAASLVVAQTLLFDCGGGAVFVPPGDYGAITIDTGATACGSVTVEDVAADSITISASGGVNVVGAIAITRLTCKPAATVCVDFTSAVVAAESITLRGATYNSTIVASGTVHAVLLRFSSAVAGVPLIEVSDVDMNANATSTDNFVRAYLTRFVSPVTSVGALAWRNTTLVATITAAGLASAATSWFDDAFSGTNATTLSWDGVSQRVNATSSSAAAQCIVTNFASTVSDVSALAWRNTTIDATLVNSGAVLVAGARFGGNLSNVAALTWGNVSISASATSRAADVRVYVAIFASVTGVGALAWHHTTLDATLTSSTFAAVATAWFNGAFTGTNSTALTWDAVAYQVSATSTRGYVNVFVAVFTSSLTDVGALTWRNTSFNATLAAATTVVFAIARFNAGLVGTTSTTLLVADAVLTVAATSDTGATRFVCATHFLLPVLDVLALTWRRVSLSARLRSDGLVPVTAAAAVFGAEIDGGGAAATVLELDTLNVIVQVASASNVSAAVAIFASDCPGLRRIAVTNSTLDADASAASVDCAVVAFTAATCADVTSPSVRVLLSRAAIVARGGSIASAALVAVTCGADSVMVTESLLVADVAAQVATAAAFLVTPGDATDLRECVVAGTTVRATVASTAPRSQPATAQLLAAAAMVLVVSAQWPPPPAQELRGVELVSVAKCSVFATASAPFHRAAGGLAIFAVAVAGAPPGMQLRVSDSAVRGAVTLAAGDAACGLVRFDSARTSVGDVVVAASRLDCTGIDVGAGRAGVAAVSFELPLAAGASGAATIAVANVTAAVGAATLRVAGAALAASLVVCAASERCAVDASTLTVAAASAASARGVAVHATLLNVSAVAPRVAVVNASVLRLTSLAASGSAGASPPTATLTAAIVTASGAAPTSGAPTSAADIAVRDSQLVDATATASSGAADLALVRLAAPAVAARWALTGNALQAPSRAGSALAVVAVSDTGALSPDVALAIDNNTARTIGAVLRQPVAAATPPSAAALVTDLRGSTWTLGCGNRWPRAVTRSFVREAGRTGSIVDVCNATSRTATHRSLTATLGPLPRPRESPTATVSLSRPERAFRELPYTHTRSATLTFATTSGVVVQRRAVTHTLHPAPPRRPALLPLARVASTSVNAAAVVAVVGPITADAARMRFTLQLANRIAAGDCADVAAGDGAPEWSAAPLQLRLGAAGHGYALGTALGNVAVLTVAFAVPLVVYRAWWRVAHRDDPGETAPSFTCAATNSRALVISAKIVALLLEPTVGAGLALVASPAAPVSFRVVGPLLATMFAGAAAACWIVLVWRRTRVEAYCRLPELSSVCDRLFVHGEGEWVIPDPDDPPRGYRRRRPMRAGEDAPAPDATLFEREQFALSLPLIENFTDRARWFWAAEASALAALGCCRIVGMLAGCLAEGAASVVVLSALLMALVALRPHRLVALHVLAPVLVLLQIAILAAALARATADIVAQLSVAAAALQLVACALALLRLAARVLQLLSDRMTQAGARDGRAAPMRLEELLDDGAEVELVKQVPRRRVATRVGGRGARFEAPQDRAAAPREQRQRRGYTGDDDSDHRWRTARRRATDDDGGAAQLDVEPAARPRRKARPAAAASKPAATPHNVGLDTVGGNRTASSRQRAASGDSASLPNDAARDRAPDPPPSPSWVARQATPNETIFASVPTHLLVSPDAYPTPQPSDDDDDDESTSDPDELLGEPLNAEEMERLLGVPTRAE